MKNHCWGVGQLVDHREPAQYRSVKSDETMIQWMGECLVLARALHSELADSERQTWGAVP